MSLNSVTSGLGAPVSQATGNVQNTVSETTKPVTNTVSDTTSDLPGTFPKDEAPTNRQNNVTIPSASELWTSIIAWVKGLIPRGVDIFEAAVRRFIQWLIPQERQAAMYKAAMEHPIAATFVTCQLICVGIPLILFVAGTLLFAAVAMLVWVVLSILILGPIVLIASLMGVSLWGWGWFLFGLVRWLDRLVLGGMMERLWKAQLQQQREEMEEENSEKEKQEGVQKETDEEKRDD
ncbi:seipin co-factor family protein [Aspergillus puulaauensis]|uniref:Uncharacterized protein n=1 Tax=Aspergillus puulaauensis TaxID=1220207 RepID=A0A7R8AMR1_9EURO|nr:uncharacterized protein APUU_40516S [Aspergillus puulaauensis]BCS24072.1 hypothetical protein APUU_40516S [Aspergillus puulaauensis]